MRPELAVAFVAGLFSLIPLIWQIASTRAQRRDRMTRLNQLRAELELLERLHTLQGRGSATDEAPKPATNVVIRDSLGKVLDQYNKLSEIAPSTVSGGKPPSKEQLSFLRRALLLYNPHTVLGWILHTLFYFFALIFVLDLPLTPSGFRDTNWLGWVIINTPLVVVLLVIQRLARRAARLEEPNA